jgi:hypothetical protein
MPSNFPTSLDSYAGHNPGDTILDTYVDDLEDAIKAIEATVGITGSAVATSHDYRIAQLEAGGAYTGATYEVWVDDYGAVGDGTTDDSTAFDDAFDAIIATLDAYPDGVLRPAVKLCLGAKSYKIVSGNTLMKLAAVTGGANGLTIEGIAPSATQVIFAPVASAYLCNNEDDWGYLTFRDIEFSAATANANFLRSQRTGSTGNPVHNYSFDRCRWIGTWGIIYDLSGDNNNSEWTFWKCDWWVTCTKILESGSDANDLFVNFWLIDCQAHITSGHGFEFTKGGNIGAVGGSWMAEANCDMFRLLGTGHGNGTCNFIRFGGRYELGASTVRTVYSEWDYGTITAIGVDESGRIGQFASHNSARFNMFNGGGGPTILYEGSSIHGKHEFIYAHTVVSQQVTYHNTNFYSEANPEDAIVYIAESGGGGNLSNAPVVHLIQCKGTSSRLVTVDVNWQLAGRAETTRRLWFVRAYGSLNPSNGFEEIVLPKNVMVVGAGMVVRGSIGTAGGILQFRTTEGTPTVLVTKTGVNAAFTTINEMNATPPAGSTTLPFRCDSDAKRTIRLVADANVNATRNDGDFWIETVG